MKASYYTFGLAGLLCFGMAAQVSAQTYTFGTLAGGSPSFNKTGDAYGGYADGTNRAAQFDGAVGIAVDNAGTVLVADTMNSVIRKLTPIGSDWVVTTVAGLAGQFGGTDGTNNQARFRLPFGIAFDRAGNLYVADGNNNAIRKMTPVGSDWVVTTLAGLPGALNATVDGIGSNARFSSPVSITVDSQTNLFVSEANNAIRKIALVGTNWVVSTIAGVSGVSGSSDGVGSVARFNYPGSIAADGSTNLFVCDTYNWTIRRLTPVGTNWNVTTIAGAVGQPGTIDGPGATARFGGSGGLVVDRNGVIFLTDAAMVRKITPAGNTWVVSTLAGMPYPNTGTNDGTGTAARFFNPQTLAVDPAGNIFVMDTDNQTVRLGQPSMSAPQPLVFARSGNQFVFRKPLAAAEFNFETAPTLSGPWTARSTGAVISGAFYVWTNTPSPGNLFYRLHKP